MYGSRMCNYLCLIIRVEDPIPTKYHGQQVFSIAIDRRDEKLLIYIRVLAATEKFASALNLIHTRFLVVIIGIDVIGLEHPRREFGLEHQVEFLVAATSCFGKAEESPDNTEARKGEPEESSFTCDPSVSI